MSNGSNKWSRINFATIFGDLYQIKLWGICNNFNQFINLSSASGPSNDVIKWRVGKINVFNKFNVSTARDCKQNSIYTEIYFTMQWDILPMSLRHEPRCSLCRMGLNVALCKFLDALWRLISN